MCAAAVSMCSKRPRAVKSKIENETRIHILCAYSAYVKVFRKTCIKAVRICIVKQLGDWKNGDPYMIMFFKQENITEKTIVKVELSALDIQ